MKKMTRGVSDMKLRSKTFQLFLILATTFLLGSVVHGEEYCVSMGEAPNSVDYYITLGSDGTVTGYANDGLHTYIVAGYFRSPFVHFSLVSDSLATTPNCHEWDIKSRTGMGLTYTPGSEPRKWSYPIALCKTDITDKAGTKNLEDLHDRIDHPDP